MVGDARIKYGGILLMMARNELDSEKQHRMLIKAKTHITKGLNLEPDPEIRAMGEQMMKGFRF